MSLQCQLGRELCPADFAIMSGSLFWMRQEGMSTQRPSGKGLEQITVATSEMKPDLKSFLYKPPYNILTPTPCAPANETFPLCGIASHADAVPPST